MGKRMLAVVTVTLLVLITVIAGVTYWPMVNSPPTQQNEFRNEYGDVTLDAPTYNFSPPVSMYQALNIALNGSWNATSLQNMTIHVRLAYCRFWNNSIVVGHSEGYDLLNYVTQPVANYSAVIVSNGTIMSTYRYLWDITITENGSIPGCPNPEYRIDASTAEILQTPGPPG